MTSRLRPMPADFVEMRQKLGGIDHLVKHYHSSSEAVARWIAEAGLPSLTRRRPPLPDDFAQMREAIGGVNKLAAHYHTSSRTIRGWLDQAGLPKLSNEPRNPRPKRASFFKMPRTGLPNVHRLNNYGPEDHAADTLRKFGAVYRCDERGKVNTKGKFWRFGNVILTPDELIQRAERKAA